MKENRISDIIGRMEKTFKNKAYRSRLSTSDKNWLGIEIDMALEGLIAYFDQYMP